MAKVTLVLEDTDINLGQFKTTLTVEGSPIDDKFATASHVAGLFVHGKFSDAAFVNEMWVWATDYVQKNIDASIANPEVAPVSGVPKAA